MVERPRKHRTYFNDNDPASAAVLRELIADGLISDGVVDDRSITEVQADDLVGFTRCHFFAGSGAWEDALDIAGWPRHWNTWLASLPCQPWSCAGKGEGCNDDRHLWPVFFDLVNQCRPDFLIGEQVEAAVGKGWLDGVRLDMARINYAFTFVVLPACCQGEEEAVLLVGEDGVREERVLVGPPHIRQRIFWGAVRVADMQCIQSERRGEHGDLGSSPAMQSCEEDQRERTGDAAGDCCSDVRIPDMQDTNLGSGEHGEETGIGQDGERRRGLAGRGVDVRMGHSESNDERRLSEPAMHGERGKAGRPGGDDGGISDSRRDRLEGAESTGGEAPGLRLRPAELGLPDGRMENPQRADDRAEEQCDEALRENPERSSSGTGGSSIWSDYSIVICRDTDKHGIRKARRIPRQGNGAPQPGILLGADGAPRVVAPDGTPGAVSTFPLASKEAWKESRVGLLRLAGNAIDPRTAAVFIEVFIEAIKEIGVIV